MCLYMNIPLWINVERLTTAVSTTASHIFDVSLVIFLLNCKSSAAAKTTTKPAVASAINTTDIKTNTCKATLTEKPTTELTCKQQIETTTINTSVTELTTESELHESSTLNKLNEFQQNDNSSSPTVLRDNNNISLINAGV